MKLFDFVLLMGRMIDQFNYRGKYVTHPLPRGDFDKGLDVFPSTDQCLEESHVILLGHLGELH